MQLNLRSILLCATFLVSLQAEGLNPTAKPAPAAKEAAPPKPKRLKWLRRIACAEVGLAMKLSAVGIPQPTPPASAAVAW